MLGHVSLEKKFSPQWYEPCRLSNAALPSYSDRGKAQPQRNKEMGLITPVPTKFSGRKIKVSFLLLILEIILSEQFWSMTMKWQQRTRISRWIFSLLREKPFGLNF